MFSTHSPKLFHTSISKFQAVKMTPAPGYYGMHPSTFYWPSHDPGVSECDCTWSFKEVITCKMRSYAWALI